MASLGFLGTRRTTEIHLAWKRLCGSLYAGDITLILDTTEEVQTLVNRCAEYAERMGLRLNAT